MLVVLTFLLAPSLRLPEPPLLKRFGLKDRLKGFYLKWFKGGKGEGQGGVRITRFTHRVKHAPHLSTLVLDAKDCCPF